MMEKNVMDNCVLPLLTAEQYASRIAMLSSLVVSWSPVMRLSSNSCMVPQNVSSNMFSILAVGGKSGEISIWRIHAPRCYSIEYGCMPTCTILIGLLQAHKSWVTAISLALLGSNSSPQVLLASGSSDGSVKIWMGNGKELLESSETNNSSFVILREVIPGNIVPVSVLSLVVPVQSLHKMLLAVGKGSGSVEVWAYDRSGCQCDNACVYDAHDCVVTALAWAFDGYCLYSSGQDDHVRCWVLCGSCLCEVPIPSNGPGLRSSNDLPGAFLSCLGVAVSPGNLVLAMVRNTDAEQLDPMYERRVLKAAVQFFWIGGQLNLLPDNSLDVSKDAFLGFPANELVHWKSSILWSLKKFENPEKPLVTWDIIAALLAFKQSIPNFVDEILFKWLSVTYLDSSVSHSLDDVLIRIPQTLLTATSRQLHLLNVICRHVILSQLMADEINSKANIGPTVADMEHSPLWLELLFISERELRERLVGLSFSAFLTHMSHSAKSSIESGNWSPVGVAQMELWITRNHDHIRVQLKELASEVVKAERRFEPMESGDEEQCIHCSALVPFDSPDVAFCCGTETVNGVLEKHKLARCSTSMQVCTTTPSWFCKCCHRWTSKLAPETLFTMPGYGSDVRPPAESPTAGVQSKALCPFCGILLQRLLPDFLPSASPV
uniref:Transducin family protein n=4 Tax=Rhizophora mucronata TaxID=61149 RepID=A0A2P2MFC5_RHIMU